MFKLPYDRISTLFDFDGRLLMVPIPQHPHNSIFYPYLNPHEFIIWQGQPNPHRLLRPVDAIWIPLRFVYLLSTLSIERQLVQTHLPLVLKLIGLPFVILGLYWLFGRLIVRYVQRRITHYALTNYRVLCLRRTWQEQLKAVDLYRIPVVRMQRGWGTTGTIIFSSPTYEDVSFEDIEQVQNVAAKLNQLRTMYTPYSANFQHYQH